MKLFPLLGAFFALLAVALGAFGAHALKSRISEHLLTIFEIGVRYQFYQALGMIACGLLLFHMSHPLIYWGGIFLVIGTCIFSGSLYMLALTDVKIWGAVTPIGGVLLLAGWLCIAIGIWKN